MTTCWHPPKAVDRRTQANALAKTQQPAFQPLSSRRLSARSDQTRAKLSLTPAGLQGRPARECCLWQMQRPQQSSAGGVTIPQSRFARQPPLHKGAFGCAAKPTLRSILTRRKRPLRAPTAKMGRMRVKLLCAIVALGSGAVGAAFEESSVAVIIARFYWPTRSREGAGSIGQDGPVERNGLGDASPWDARRGAPRGRRGPQPPERFGDSSPRGKVPRRRQPS